MVVKSISIFVLVALLQLQSHSKNINVKSFGAKGNGKTDDTRAFQAAINSLPNKGNNSIYIPKGTYLIGSYTTTYNYFENYCLLIHSGIQFKGEGNTSIIRLASHIFDKEDSFANAHLFFGINIQNVQFTNLMIDMNGMNNFVPKKVIKNHSAIFINDGNNLLIKNVVIKNCAGRNMLIVKGKGNNVTIKSSKFLNGGNYVGSPLPNQYQDDFSFIYTEWDSTYVINNYIEQQNIDIALSGFTGGIEIHGAYSKASNNTIIGCNPAVFITSSFHPMEKTSVENNKMSKCLKGVSFWVNYPMNNIIIANNNIELTYSRLLKPNIIAGIEIPNGNSTIYSFQMANNAPLSNVLISGNIIKAILLGTTMDLAAGMVLHSLQNSTIINNNISGVNYGGLLLLGSKWGISKLLITKNKFEDFKNGGTTKAVGGYVIITDTYSTSAINAPGIKDINFIENDFLYNNLQSKSNTTNAIKKKNFFGAFIALPEYMHKEIYFKRNHFSNKEEEIYFLKTQ